MCIRDSLNSPSFGSIAFSSSNSAGETSRNKLSGPICVTSVRHSCVAVVVVASSIELGGEGNSLESLEDKDSSEI